ncbi:MAG: cytochrome c biogenesis protein CcdA [Candidatus Atribacteria bacterium]|nr:cytochrome c biogenesis protein CcdA [Candidatus Atribacteria bacterium]
MAKSEVGEAIVELNILVSFVAGVLSFLSPCVLAIAPAYVSYISGVESVEKERGKVITHTILFVLGFAGIFVLLGMGASWMGGVFATYRVWFNRIAGLIIVIFGLQVLGILKIRTLYVDKHVRFREDIAHLRSFVLGLSFGLGWTPCVGPILGSILLYVSSFGEIWRGGVLLGFYALGLAIPFLLVGLGWGYLWKVLQGLQKRGRVVELVSGCLLVGLGLIMVLGKMEVLFSSLGAGGFFAPESLLVK